LKACVVRLDKALKVLEKALSFAVNNSLGYISTCPKNLGTGLEFSFVANVPW
jgi:protein-arginine kinase